MRIVPSEGTPERIGAVYTRTPATERRRWPELAFDERKEATALASGASALNNSCRTRGILRRPALSTGKAREVFPAARAPQCAAQERAERGG